MTRDEAKWTIEHWESMKSSLAGGVVENYIYIKAFSEGKDILIASFDKNDVVYINLPNPAFGGFKYKIRSISGTESVQEMKLGMKVKSKSDPSFQRLILGMNKENVFMIHSIHSKETFWNEFELVED